MIKPWLAAIWVLVGWSVCRADPAATEPSRAAGGTDKLAGVHVDVKNKRVEVDCQALNVTAPLEFFCVINGGNEHESVLRTPAKPSDIHFGLLMLGLKPGAPATYIPSRRVWQAPYGPGLKLSCRYLLHDKPVDVPAYRMMRSLETKKEMPPTTWVFDGSRVMPDGVYAADITGYVVSICNFDLTMIDVPRLVSNANETLEWECNPEFLPPKGTPVKLVIEPAQGAAAGAATQPVQAPADQFNPGPGLSAMPATPRTQPDLHGK